MTASLLELLLVLHSVAPRQFTDTGDFGRLKLRFVKTTCFSAAAGGKNVSESLPQPLMCVGSAFTSQ